MSIKECYYSENTARDSRRQLPPAVDRDLGIFNTQRYDIGKYKHCIFSTVLHVNIYLAFVFRLMYGTVPEFIDLVFAKTGTRNSGTVH